MRNLDNLAYHPLQEALQGTLTPQQLPRSGPSIYDLPEPYYVSYLMVLSLGIIKYLKYPGFLSTENSKQTLENVFLVQNVLPVYSGKLQVLSPPRAQAICGYK
jgi:hypothetical protein